MAEAPSINWEIEPARENNGLGDKRFDAWRQSDTLGPEPESPSSGPPETTGEPGNPPKAG